MLWHVRKKEYAQEKNAKKPANYVCQDIFKKP